MNISTTLKQMKSERNKLNKAIDALESLLGKRDDGEDDSFTTKPKKRNKGLKLAVEKVVNEMERKLSISAITKRVCSALKGKASNASVSHYLSQMCKQKKLKRLSVGVYDKV